MLLSDEQIHQYLQDDQLVIVGPIKKLPFNKRQVQPCSIDLRLGSRFLKFRKEIKRFDVKDLKDVWNYLDEYEFQKGSKIILEPHETIFGEIYERLRIPSDTAGIIEGRSRFVRLGISIHATGGFINPEFEGTMPLQITNNDNIPFIIYPFMEVCQLLLFKLTSIPAIPY